MLHSSARMRKAVPKVPVVGERNPRSMRSLLMPSALPQVGPTLEQTGVVRCGDGCVICREHLVEGRFFSSSTTGERFTVRHSMNCRSSNIIYLLYCQHCHGAQYVGETKNTLRTRFYLHRSHISKNMGTHVTKHFNSQGHTLQDMKCMPIEQILSDSHAHRHKREQFWICKLKTRHPQGLNTL